MFLKKAQEEHDYFVEKLRAEGIEVFYIEKLVAQTLDLDPQIREKFIYEFVTNANIQNNAIKKAVLEYLKSIEDNYELVKASIAGITKKEISPIFSRSLEDICKNEENYPFYLDPIPNILFQRDPIASIFDQFNIHNMWSKTRKRESIYYTFLFKYHPDFKDIKILMNPLDSGHIEGGDILIINKELIFIGISQRSSAKGVQIISEKLFNNFSELKTIIGVKIPESHATMHLDTLMTQIDINKFLIDPDFKKSYNQYFVVTKIETKEIHGMIKDILEQYVHKNIQLFTVGDQDIISSKREQWNDGANCLAIAPNKVIVYDRNVLTNSLLKKSGIEFIEIKSSELSRGRGGPRCMTMPLYREEVFVPEKGDNIA